jgi:hypothetical protein
MKKGIHIQILFFIGLGLSGCMTSTSLFMPTTTSISITASPTIYMGIVETPQFHVQLCENEGNQGPRGFELHIKVVNKMTHEPIQGAFVYLGSGYCVCKTDNEGMCDIGESSFGSYGLTVYAKGYHRFTVGGDWFEIGEYSFIVEIEKRTDDFSSFYIEGTILHQVTGKGSKSENNYYKLAAGREEYIFNEIGHNYVGAEFINRNVRIKGYWDIGYIGWEHNKVEGIYVEEIVTIDKEPVLGTLDPMRTPLVVRTPYIGWMDFYVRKIDVCTLKTDIYADPESYPILIDWGDEMQSQIDKDNIDHKYTGSGIYLITAKTLKGLIISKIFALNCKLTSSPVLGD